MIRSKWMPCIQKGLATTADKIRALAHADWDRTEISKILGIRYQRVRNVMLRSDLSGGMQCKAEAECEPVEVDAARGDTPDGAHRRRLSVHRGTDPSPGTPDPARRQSVALPANLSIPTFC